jgi:hypothetical protein
MKMAVWDVRPSWGVSETVARIAKSFIHTAIVAAKKNNSIGTKMNSFAKIA